MAEEPVVVKVMREGHVPALVEIDAVASGSPRPEYLKSKMQAALATEHGMVISLVAEIEDRAVGFLMGEVHRGEFGIPESVALVDTVGVHPEFQGRGVATRLMDEFTALAHKAGVERIRTVVDWNKQWELMKYFKKAGFAPAGSSIILERVL
ncbi:MAG: GNAT family N-acetyltransferase [Planctomycetota bacterium]|jgi:ribosomal protein S18 acetylase RimI-like enzyme